MSTGSWDQRYTVNTTRTILATIDRAAKKKKAGKYTKFLINFLVIFREAFKESNDRRKTTRESTDKTMSVIPAARKLSDRLVMFLLVVLLMNSEVSLGKSRTNIPPSKNEIGMETPRTRMRILAETIMSMNMVRNNIVVISVAAMNADLFLMPTIIKFETKFRSSEKLLSVVIFFGMQKMTKRVAMGRLNSGCLQLETHIRSLASFMLPSLRYV